MDEKEEQFDEKKSESEEKSMSQSDCVGGANMVISFRSEILTQNKDLRIFGTGDFPWFVGKDIAEFLGYTNTEKAIRIHVEEEDKILWGVFSEKSYPVSGLEKEKLSDKNMKYNSVLITLRGVKSLITSGKKHNDELIRWLDNTFNMKTIVIKRLTKEQEYISYIKQTFSIETMKEQYRIDNYRIDLFFPDYNIAIECDENNHTDRNPISEKKRQKEIIAKTGCVFIRFNPDENNFNIFNVISKIYKIIITQKNNELKLLKKRK